MGDHRGGAERRVGGRLAGAGAVRRPRRALLPQRRQRLRHRRAARLRGRRAHQVGYCLVARAKWK